MKQCYLVNSQFGLIAAYMAVVLSNPENIDLLLLLVKVAIAIGVLAIGLGLLFWLKLKNLEKHIFLNRKQVKSRFAPKNYPKMQRTLVANTVSSRPNVTITRKLSSKTQIYRPQTFSKPCKKSPKHSGKSSWRWLLAIAIASITGIAIALLQFSNGLISFDLRPLIWLLIGLVLVVGATLE